VWGLCGLGWGQDGGHAAIIVAHEELECAGGYEGLGSRFGKLSQFGNPGGKAEGHKDFAGEARYQRLCAVPYREASWDAGRGHELNLLFVLKYLG
jgi:hypothetical protein